MEQNRKEKAQMVSQLESYDAALVYAKISLKTPNEKFPVLSIKTFPKLGNDVTRMLSLLCIMIT